MGLFTGIIFVMTKILNGKELSLFIKERQSKEVRSLKQSKNISPCLTIIRTNPNPATDTYVNLKVRYGEDVGVKVVVIDCSESDLEDIIKKCNDDPSINGVIVQLPLKSPENTERMVNLIDANKDVDGLGVKSIFDAATPMAINWLLAGYNIDLIGKKLVVVGSGKLVGAPLAEMWLRSGYDVTVITSDTNNKKDILLGADVIVSATGSPGVITSDMVKQGAVIVDAGVATDKNELVGDVGEDVRVREDIVITPVKGGVGPLTVAALFNNVLLATRNSTK